MPSKNVRLQGTGVFAKTNPNISVGSRGYSAGGNDGQIAVFDSAYGGIPNGDEIRMKNIAFKFFIKSFNS